MLRITTAVMQKYNIQIRAITQLFTSKFSIGHDTELCFAQLAMHHVTRQPVTLDKMVPRQLQHLFQHHLGNTSEIVADTRHG